MTFLLIIIAVSEMIWHQIAGLKSVPWFDITSEMKEYYSGYDYTAFWWPNNSVQTHWPFPNPYINNCQEKILCIHLSTVNGLFQLMLWHRLYPMFSTQNENHIDLQSSNCNNAPYLSNILRMACGFLGAIPYLFPCAILQGCFDRPEGILLTCNHT